jgi:hypothetical protein
MPDNTEEKNYETVRVAAHVKSRLLDEQNRIRKEAGRKPSLSHLISSGLDALDAARLQPEGQKNPSKPWNDEGTGRNDSAGIDLTTTHSNILNHHKNSGRLNDLLEQIIASGHTVAITALEHNLEAFARLVSIDGVAHGVDTISDDHVVDREAEIEEIRRENERLSRILDEREAELSTRTAASRPKRAG